jgi:hypothetical protein
MADLSHLSDDELDAAIKSHSPDLSHMSDADLDAAIKAASPAPPEEPLGHKIIRQGLPLLGQVAGGMGAGALATPETFGAGAIPAAMAGAGVGKAGGEEAASWLNHEIYGDEAPTYNSLEDAGRVATNFGIGAASELGGQALAKGAGAIANSAVAKPVIESAGNGAANLFEKAGQSLAAPTITKEVETGLLDIAGKPITKTVEAAAESAKDGLFSKFADKAATAIGAKVAGPVGAVLAPQAREAISSSMSSVAGGLSKVLKATPSFFGKWAPVLANAAARGELSLNASAYVLQQQDPEFRQKMQELNNRSSSQADDGKP